MIDLTIPRRSLRRAAYDDAKRGQTRLDALTYVPAQVAPTQAIVEAAYEAAVCDDGDALALLRAAVERHHEEERRRRR